MRRRRNKRCNAEDENGDSQRDHDADGDRSIGNAAIADPATYPDCELKQRAAQTKSPRGYLPRKRKTISIIKMMTMATSRMKLRV